MSRYSSRREGGVQSGQVFSSFWEEEREVGGTAPQSGGNDWTGWDGYMGRPSIGDISRGEAGSVHHAGHVWVFDPLGLGPGAGVALYRSYEWLAASLPPHFSAAALECWIRLSLDYPARRYFPTLTGPAVESAGMGCGQASGRALRPACARIPHPNHKFPPTPQGFWFDPMAILALASPVRPTLVW